MKYIVEGGTDCGAMLLFDPAALPHDYDKQAKGDPTSILEAATLNGDAFWIKTDGDGSYLLHAFVDEAVSPELTDFLRDEKKVLDFKVPSGRLYFTGVEYGFQHDDSFLKKHPHMGGAIEIEPGHYSLSLFRTEYPEEIMEKQLRERVSNIAFRLHQSMSWFVMLALVGLVCAVVSFIKSGPLPFLLPVAIVLITLPFVICRFPSYRNTDNIWNEIQRRYPSIVTVLRTTKAESDLHA